MAFSFLNKNKNILILLIPAVIAFIIALIPTIKYQWPLSWDIYYHVHLAKLYMEQGIVYYDHLTYAPYGRPIFYPPLIHFLLAAVSSLFKIDPFQAARALQPLFAFFMVFSLSYMGYKLYDLSVGAIAGFFLFLTEIFHRSILVIPETMALIFLPPSIYLYYISLEKNSYIYAVISGILGGLTLLTHSLTAGILALIIITFTIILKIKHQKVNLKHFWIFSVALLVTASFWWLPLLLKYGYVFNNPLPDSLSAEFFLIALAKSFGIPLIFALIAITMIFKRNEIKRNNILIISWFVVIILLGSIYLAGIPILVDRVLNFATFAVVILAAIGLKYLKMKFNIKIYYILVSFLVIGSIFSSSYYAIAVKPMVSDSEQDIGNYFTIHGDKEGIIMSLTPNIDPIIVSISRQPISAGGYHPGAVKHLNMDTYYFMKYNQKNLIDDNIKYFIIETGMKNPNFSKLVYQNKKYKVFVVE